MLTIFINEVEHNSLDMETQKKLKKSYTRSGRNYPSVLGYTFKELPRLEISDYIEINGVMYEVMADSRIRFFGGTRESMDPVQQIFLREDD